VPATAEGQSTPEPKPHSRGAACLPASGPGKGTSVVVCACERLLRKKKPLDGAGALIYGRFLRVHHHSQTSPFEHHRSEQTYCPCSYDECSLR
jgi:hypothetical protein